MFEAEEYLKTECADIDYTVVQAPMLDNKPASESSFKVTNDEYYVRGASDKLSRTDMVRYILKIPDDKSTYGQIQAIALEIKR